MHRLTYRFRVILTVYKTLISLICHQQLNRDLPLSILLSHWSVNFLFYPYQLPFALEIVFVITSRHRVPAEHSEAMADAHPKSAYYGLFISILMVVTGSMNTITAKWADSIKVDGKLFDHPFLQATCMFIGEFSCLVVFFIIHFIKRRRYNNRHRVGVDGGAHEIDSVEIDDEVEEAPTLPQFNPFVFLPPACCDVIGTSLMYIGLNLTQASSFQMLRGAVIIFTGLLSVAFLNMKLKGYKWLGDGIRDPWIGRRGNDGYSVRR
ncbi:hypothetical protein L596_029551 [Steinernema carpocapsae]|uniref:Uncharacterized protein n=1 Tax=Steinernema carpocapsae TaxID=34508 RepID=A0A4U5LV02_STECR|nr:hypothetical protein L596_029551 [Steinernema carpocapsae]